MNNITYLKIQNIYHIFKGVARVRVLFLLLLVVVEYFYARVLNNFEFLEERDKERKGECEIHCYTYISTSVFD